jgi:hypothetical protein
MSRLVLMGVLAGLLAAGAGEARASVNGREHNQRERIAAGVRSGELTKREAARLTAQQAAIRAEERRFRHNDGVLGPWERAHLNGDMNQASRSVYRQRHDGQVR